MGGVRSDIRQIPALEEPDSPFEFKETPQNRNLSAPRSIHWTKKRLFYRSMTTGAIAISPLFAYFQYPSIYKAGDLILQKYETDDSSWAYYLLRIMTLYLTLMSIIGDPPTLNAVEESESLLQGNDEEPVRVSTALQFLSPINRFLATLSFAHFAADNAIAISGLTSNNRAFYLGLGIPIMAFSITHQYVMAKNDLEAHYHRFILSIRTLHTAESSLLHILKSPLKSLEVSIESFSNIAYQGISAGYISDQLAKVFDFNETDPAVIPWIMTATLLTAYTTTFSHVIPVYDLYFKPEYETLTAAELQSVRVPFKDHLLNSGVALTRAATLGWLVYRFGPSDTRGSVLTVTSVSLTAFIHPFYVLYQQQKNELALSKRRRDSLLLDLMDLEFIGQTPRNSSKKLFDQLAKHYETPRLKRTVTLINVSARIAQLLSFIGFVADIMETLNANGYSYPLNLTDTIALAILWGTPIAISEGRVNQEPLVQGACYHQAKALIGAPTGPLARKNIVTRAVASFFYSKHQFSANRLANILRRMEYAGEEEMVSLMGRGPG